MNILVVAGFLGAGKTTFIRELSGRTQRQIAVYENECGQADIDARILRDDEALTVWESLDNCICCTGKQDFASSVLTIANTIDPDILVVEPTGIARLSSVLANIDSVRYERIGLLPSIAIVGADTWVRQHDQFPSIYVDQVASAGTVVISKADRAGAGEVAAAAAWAHERNPEAVVVDTPYQQLPNGWFEGLLVGGRSGADADATAERAGWAGGGTEYGATAERAGRTEGGACHVDAALGTERAPDNRAPTAGAADTPAATVDPAGARAGAATAGTMPAVAMGAAGSPAATPATSATTPAATREPAIETLVIDDAFVPTPAHLFWLLDALSAGVFGHVVRAKGTVAYAGAEAEQLRFDVVDRAWAVTGAEAAKGDLPQAVFIGTDIKRAWLLEAFSPSHADSGHAPAGACLRNALGRSGSNRPKHSR